MVPSIHDSTLELEGAQGRRGFRWAKLNPLSLIGSRRERRQNRQKNGQPQDTNSGRPRRLRNAGFATISLAGVSFAAASPAEGSGSPKSSPQPVMELAGRPTTAKEAAAVVVEVPPPKWRLVAADLAAGATAGASVEAALYPIDTIKTRLQMMKEGGGIKALLAGAGGQALYAGIWGNLAGVIPASAIFFAVYEPLKKHAEGWSPENKNVVGPLVAGAGAGIAASIVRVPTEVIKQRMQMGEFKTAVSAIGSILSKEGVRGMYAGYGSFLLRDLPFDAIEFFAYEQLKHAHRAFSKREPTSMEISVMGAGSGAITGLATTPLDVLKTRLMTQGSKREYKGIVDCATKIMKEEGVGGFLRGWQPRVLWIGIGGSVFFTALELSKKLYAPKPQFVEVVAEEPKKKK